MENQPYTHIDTTPTIAIPINHSHWSENGIEISLSSIDRLQRTLLSTVETLYETDANQPLPLLVNRCLEGLQRFYEGVLLTKQSLDLNFNHTIVDNVPLSLIEKDYVKSLDEALSLDRNQDRERLADILECDLLTLLSSWKRGLIHLKAIHNTNR